MKKIFSRQARKDRKENLHPYVIEPKNLNSLAFFASLREAIIFDYF
jgi:hypothetical protein